MQNVGGQAVLEGVMMRSPSCWALAVRKPNGEIADVNFAIRSPMARHRVFRLPVIRGVIALGESLAIGFRALAISANYAAQEEGENGEVSTEISRGALIFAFAIAIGFAVALFKVTPALLTSWLPIDGTGAFVVVEGLIRVTIFILYLSLISLLPDLRRVFQYHAAEHGFDWVTLHCGCLCDALACWTILEIRSSMMTASCVKAMRAPRFKFFLDRKPPLKCHRLGRRAMFLDVGAGYGPVSQYILGRFPNATCVGQDGSEIGGLDEGDSRAGGIIG